MTQPNKNLAERLQEIQEDIEDVMLRLVDDRNGLKDLMEIIDNRTSKLERLSRSLDEIVTEIEEGSASLTVPASSAFSIEDEDEDFNAEYDPEDDDLDPDQQETSFDLGVPQQNVFNL